MLSKHLKGPGFGLCVRVSTCFDRLSMTNGERIIIIPRANPVNAYTMGGIIKDAGLTVEDFKELL